MHATVPEPLARRDQPYAPRPAGRLARTFAIVSAMLCSAPLTAQPYVRGDITGDEIVNITDLNNLLDYYFGGFGPFTADNIDAFDVTADGARSVSDYFLLSRHLFLTGEPIPAPFPTPGEPPTPAPPAESRFVRFQIEDAAGAPGATLTVPVFMTYLQREAVPPKISSYTVGFRFDPSYLTLQSISLPSSVAALSPQIAAPLVGADEGRVAVLFDAIDLDVGFDPGDNIAIAILTFMVNTPPAGAPLETGIKIVDDAFSSFSGADRSLFTEAVMNARMVRPVKIHSKVTIDPGTSFIRGDTDGDGAIVPATDTVHLLSFLNGSAALGSRIGADANDDGLLTYADALTITGAYFLGYPFPPAPHPTAGFAPMKTLPARSGFDSLTIDDGEFEDGVTGTVTVKMTNSTAADGVTVHLAYDPSRLSIVNVAPAPGLPPLRSGSPTIFVDAARERIFFSADFVSSLPPSTNVPVLQIDADPLTFDEEYTHFCFWDAMDPPFTHNEIMRLQSTGGSIRPTLQSGKFAVNKRFSRADCNQDGSDDISDAVRMLQCGFFGRICTCLDACDANDDGALDISDPLWLLNFLFLGLPPPPAPFRFCALDPTPDLIPFCSDSSCP